MALPITYARAYVEPRRLRVSYRLRHTGHWACQRHILTRCGGAGLYELGALCAGSALSAGSWTLSLEQTRSLLKRSCRPTAALCLRCDRVTRFLHCAASGR